MFSNGIGIDISDTYLRLAWLSHRGVIKALKEVALPAGLMIDDEVRKPELLKTVIAQMLEDTELKGLKGSMTVLIPESRVFVASNEFPGDRRLEEIEMEAVKKGQESIPIPFRDAAIDVEFGGVNNGQRIVSVLATPRKIIDSLVGALQGIGMPIVAIEANSASVHRMVQEFADPAVHDTNVKMILDFGHTWVNLAFFNIDSVPLLSRSVRVSSLINEGEELSATHLSTICDILAETVGFFETSDHPVSVYLAGTGGGDDAISTCSEKLKTFTVSRIQDAASFPNLSAEQVQAFAAAIGAAKRSVKPRNYISKHNFNVAIPYEGK